MLALLYVFKFNWYILHVSEDFVSATRCQKWDRIKIICRQPFQKFSPFGVSLLCVFTDDGNNVCSSTIKQKVPSQMQEGKVF